MEGDRRVAISRFYSEEFLRHIEYLQAAGVLDDSNREVAERARQVFVNRFDELCALRDFPAVAELLLRRFETLSGLSACDRRQHH
jgi:hypothetical protein